MCERPRIKELIFTEDLNVKLERTRGKGRDKEIAVVVATTGLEYILEHFLL